MNGTSFFDLLLLIIFVVFIITRFMSHKLPRDDNKNSKQGGPRNRAQQPAKKAPPERGRPGQDGGQGNVVPLGQRENPQAPQTQFSREEIDDMQGVDKIRAADPTFDEKEFKQGARQAYMLYQQAVAEGDEETLANLVSPRLFDQITEAIDQLDEAGKHRVTRIDSFDTVEIVDTRISGQTALIDLKYTVTQAQSDVKADTTSTQAKGKKTSTVWTWARNLADEDPNWELEDIKPVN